MQCIRPVEGQDVLIWGYTDRGMFNIKEAYNIRIGNRVEEKETWKNIWTLILWPKVGLFAWLVVKGCILTCENLQKHGVHGPSQCCLCSQAKETTSHLLDSFPFAVAIWDKGPMGFRKRDRKRSQLARTLMEWKQKTFKNRIIRTLCNSLPGMIMWCIWNERNGRIFLTNESASTRSCRQ